MKKLILVAAIGVFLTGAAFANDNPPVRPLTVYMVEELESWESRLEKEKNRALAPLPTLSAGSMAAAGERNG
ncbi:MAG: hypothetical protein LUG50_11445 [Planctomycetaceae bacterium]|nr:hypothetical protein [Planctomycetaceae bacterium]